MQPQEDYKVVQGATKEALSTAVHNETITYERWQPIGGVAVSANVFYQAMVKGRRGGLRKTRKTRGRKV